MYYARSTGMAFLYYKLLTDRVKTQKNQPNDTFLAVFRLLSIHAVTTHNLGFHWNVYNLNTFRFFPHYLPPSTDSCFYREQRGTLRAYMG